MKTLRNCLIVLALLYAGCIVYAYLPYRTVVPKTLAVENSRFIDIDGTMVHCTVQGSGPALVLVHGFGGSTIVWDRLIPYLKPHFTVYALDVPGFGLSDKPVDASYDVSSQADTVCAFITALDFEQTFLIGHSMGGVIVADVAAKLPDRVMKLVMIEPGFYHTGPPAFFRYLFFPFGRAAAKSFYSHTGRAKSLQASYYDTTLVTTEMVDAFLTARHTPGAVAALEAMTRGHNYDDLYGHIAAAVTRPSLLIWGNRGEKTPTADIERSHREVTGSQLLVIEQCGHYVQIEKPAQTAQAVVAFFQQPG